MELNKNSKIEREGGGENTTLLLRETRTLNKDKSKATTTIIYTPLLKKYFLYTANTKYCITSKNRGAYPL